MSQPADDWSFHQLAILKRYLCAYTAAQQERELSTAYIDAFAGANYRVDDRGDSSLVGFPDLATASAKELLKHSARTALSAEPPFDGYVFIEQDPHRRRVLEALRHHFADRNIQIRRTEPNRELRRISHLKWHDRRAVVFIDAYATNLTWETVVSIARTKAMDLWLLYPVGFGWNQLPTRATTFPSRWHECLTELLRDEDWVKALDEPGVRVEERVTAVADCVRRGLYDAFANVSTPRVMRSTSGTPLYLLCFASACPGADGQLALEVADHLLKVREQPD